MNSAMSALHSSESRFTTATPRERSRSSPPMNVRFSPITTRGIPYRRIAPVHMSHGESVVYIVARRYTDAARRPAFSSASVSPCRMALPCWTRRLCPTPRTRPSATRAAPIGTPPSSRPMRACSMAWARSSRSWLSMRSPFVSAAPIGLQVRAGIRHVAPRERQRADHDQVGERQEQLEWELAESRQDPQAELEREDQREEQCADHAAADAPAAEDDERHAHPPPARDDVQREAAKEGEGD